MLKARKGGGALIILLCSVYQELCDNVIARSRFSKRTMGRFRACLRNSFGSLRWGLMEVGHPDATSCSSRCTAVRVSYDFSLLGAHRCTKSECHVSLFPALSHLRCLMVSRRSRGKGGRGVATAFFLVFGFNVSSPSL